MPRSFRRSAGQLLAATGLLATAACGGGGSESPPSLKQGKWMISTSISDVQGVPEDQAQSMKSMAGQYSLCVDAANAADGLRLVMGKALDGDCTLKQFSGGDSASASFSCTGSKGPAEAAAKGKVSAEAINLQSVNTAADPATKAQVTTTMAIRASTSKACS